MLSILGYIGAGGGHTPARYRGGAMQVSACTWHEQIPFAHLLQFMLGVI